MTHRAGPDFGPECGCRSAREQVRRCREQKVNHLRAFGADDMTLSFHATARAVFSDRAPPLPTS